MQNGLREESGGRPLWVLYMYRLTFVRLSCPIIKEHDCTGQLGSSLQQRSPRARRYGIRNNNVTVARQNFIAKNVLAYSNPGYRSSCLYLLSDRTRRIISHIGKRLEGLLGLTFSVFLFPPFTINIP